MLSRTNIILEARSWLGTPYYHQASMKGAGADCLGLIRGLWRSCYENEPEPCPPYRADWQERGKHEPLLCAAQKHFEAIEHPMTSSLILFRWHPDTIIKHCAIMTEANTIIHAYDPRGVIESPWGSHWKKRMTHAFDFPHFKTKETQ